MAHVISDECVSCGACEAECPVGAISQGADHYEIDADACVDCGACAAQCPRLIHIKDQKKLLHERMIPTCSSFFFIVRRLSPFFAVNLCYDNSAIGQLIINKGV